MCYKYQYSLPPISPWFSLNLRQCDCAASGCDVIGLRLTTWNRINLNMLNWLRTDYNWHNWFQLKISMMWNAWNLRCYRTIETELRICLLKEEWLKFSDMQYDARVVLVNPEWQWEIMDSQVNSTSRLRKRIQVASPWVRSVQKWSRGLYRNLIYVYLTYVHW